MRTYLRIQGINDKDHPAEVVQQIVTVAPEGEVVRGLFRIRILESDPRSRQILEILNAAGIAPRKFGESRRDYRNFYTLSRYREYDDSDFEGLELMQVYPQAVMQSERLPGSIWGVRHREVQKAAHFTRGLLGGDRPIMVPDRIRRTLVSEEFRGLTFTPMKLLRNTRNPDDDAPEANDWSSIGEPWWMMDSGIIMPPLSPYLQRINPNTGEVLARNASATIREPGFDDVEFHYLRSELRQMPEFDVARDFETGGSAAVIVNRRFYDYCKAHNFKCGFKPVRIDED